MRLSRRSRFCFSATYLVRIAMTDVVYLMVGTLSPLSPSPYQGEGEHVFLRWANAPLKHPD